MRFDPSKLTICRTCEAPLVKAPGETPKQFERRTKDGYCRGKCKPKPSRGRPAVSNFGVSIPEDKERRRVSTGFLSNYLEGRKVNTGPRPFTGSFFKEEKEEDPLYLGWIRERPCLICGRKAEAHHQNKEGDAAMSGKCSDRRALPLCFEHHTGGGTDAFPGSYHGQAKAGGSTGRAFWAQYGIDPEKQIVVFNLRYDIEKKGKEQ